MIFLASKFDVLKTRVISDKATFFSCDLLNQQVSLSFEICQFRYEWKLLSTFS